MDKQRVVASVAESGTEFIVFIATAAISGNPVDRVCLLLVDLTVLALDGLEGEDAVSLLKQEIFGAAAGVVIYNEFSAMMAHTFPAILLIVE